MSRSRQQLSAGGTSSTVERLAPQHGDPQSLRVSGTLRLRADDEPTADNNEANGPTRRIRWSEDVVDNEGMGKKSSKVCCIYHKPRQIGESSSESDSSDSDSSDSDHDTEPGDRQNRSAAHQNDSTNDCDNSPARPNPRAQTVCHGHRHKHSKRRKPSPNAYEKMPKGKTR